MTDILETVRGLQLSSSANVFIGRLWFMIQALDDYVDCDADVPLTDKRRLVWESLIGFANDEFFVAHRTAITPVLETALLKWVASDDVERDKDRATAESAFSWRASFYDVVLYVYTIEHGAPAALAAAKHILCLYGERFEDYVKECY